MPGVLKISQYVHVISSLAGILIRSHILILQLYQHYFTMTLGYKLFEFPNHMSFVISVSILLLHLVLNGEKS